MFEAIACLPPGDAMQVTRMGRQGLLLSRAYGDPVEVWVVDGRPSRFVWRGRLYTVRQVLEHWVATRDWCAEVLGWTFPPPTQTPDGNYHLFAYAEIESEERWQAIASTPVCRRWWRL